MSSPVHSFYFSLCIPCLTNATSEEIFTALKSIDYVGTDNYMRADPRADISWIDAIQSFKVLRDCDEAVVKPCWRDHVKQELAVAFAVHSSTSLRNQQIFDWIDFTVFL
jgi:hypothetical protein